MELSLTDKYFNEKRTILSALHNVFDPELYVNIVDLGLVYDINLDDPSKIVITMTLSTPHCPLEEAITNGIINVLKTVFPDRMTEISIEWEPAWNFSMMTEEGKNQLGVL